MRATKEAAVRRIQPIMRGHLGRKYFAWVKFHHVNGRIIQRNVRGFLARQVPSHKTNIL